MKLYFAPRTRATRPRWLLEELAVPYELVRLDLSKREHKAPAYLAVHPLGVVPAMEIDGQPLVESVALILTLADRYPEKGLAPHPQSVERAQYNQWIVYALTNLEPALLDVFAHTVRLPEDQRDPAAAARAKERFRTAMAPLDALLSRQDWVLATGFSAADVVVASMLIWGRFMGMLDGLTAAEAYAKRAAARPAYTSAQL